MVNAATVGVGGSAVAVGVGASGVAVGDGDGASVALAVGDGLGVAVLVAIGVVVCVGVAVGAGVGRGISAARPAAAPASTSSRGAPPMTQCRVAARCGRQIDQVGAVGGLTGLPAELIHQQPLGSHRTNRHADGAPASVPVQSTVVVCPPRSKVTASTSPELLLRTVPKSRR